jgi:hypothetical protein
MRPAKCVRSHFRKPDVPHIAGLDHVRYGADGVFEGYAQAAIASGLLVTLLDDWLPKFPGPFLYYPGGGSGRRA